MCHFETHVRNLTLDKWIMKSRTYNLVRFNARWNSLQSMPSFRKERCWKWPRPGKGVAMQQVSKVGRQVQCVSGFLSLPCHYMWHRLCRQLCIKAWGQQNYRRMVFIFTNLWSSLRYAAAPGVTSVCGLLLMVSTKLRESCWSISNANEKSANQLLSAVRQFTFSLN